MNIPSKEQNLSIRSSPTQNVSYLLFPSVPSTTLFLPQFTCSSAASGNTDRIPQMAGWDACKKTINQSWPLPLSTAVFSWVEEAADVGKQGCNTQHGDANDVGVGTHVAKGALTAASRLHLHGWCAQRLLQRSASCSRTGSGAHEAEHRRAGHGQEHTSEQVGASHVVSFGTKRAAQERPSKSSSSSQKHCGVRRMLTTMNVPSNEQNV